MKIVLLSLLTTAALAFEPCRSIGSMRIDTPEAVASMRDVCEVRGGIGIFTRGVERIAFPRLKSVQGIVNVEAEDLRAVHFPKLERVGYLILNGAELEFANFPELRSARNLFIHSRRLKTVDFSRLGTVTKMNIQNNPALRFLFLDRLYDVRELLLEGNPSLVEGMETILRSATRIVTEEEQRQIERGREQVEEFKRRMLEQAMNQPPLPPTGHPTYFGVGYYYAAYPRYYWDFRRLPYWW